LIGVNFVCAARRPTASAICCANRASPSAHPPLVAALERRDKFAIEHEAEQCAIGLAARLAPAPERTIDRLR
jgi:hypothetical protein